MGGMGGVGGRGCMGGRSKDDWDEVSWARGMESEG